MLRNFARHSTSLLAFTIAFATATQALAAPPATEPALAAADTTVVAAPGTPGVTVVVPTPQGGTVTASGCTSVMVNGAPTIVNAGDPACAPYKPYQPPPPPPPQIIYVREDVAPKFKPDAARSTSLVLGAIGQGIGSIYLGLHYIDASEDHARAQGCSAYGSYDDYSYGGSSSSKKSCRADGAFGELLLYGAAMTLLPVIPRFVVGDTKGGLIYGGLIAGSIALGKGLDMNDDKTRTIGTYGALFGYVVPAALGIVALATTPHREDLEKSPSTSPTIEKVTPIPLTDARGTHGGALSMTGVF